MTFNPYARQRRSIRLQSFDYSRNGVYYITICSYNKKCLFGEIDTGEIYLNPFGKIASDCWLSIPSHFPFVELDEFVIMPNHVHGIINISNLDCRGIACYAPTEHRLSRFGGVTSSSVSSIIRAYKSAVTKSINELRRNPGAPVWQRNFYEHIIRDETDLNSIREYIKFNPLK
jgi:REP element-mobilizing transposase RayT